MPALVSQTAQAIDPTVRHVQAPTLGGTVAQTLESRTPGLTSRAPAVIDITGQPLKRDPSQLGGMNPFFQTRSSDDPVVKELARLGIPTPITPPYVKLRGQQSPLTEAERQQLAEQEGRDFYSRATKLIRSSTWTRLSDERKRERVSDLRRVVSDGRAQRLLKIREGASPIRSQIAGRSLRRDAN